MSQRRITISLPEEIAAKAQRAVDSGQVGSVSAYFAELAEREPDWAEAQRITEAVLAELGEVSTEDEEWVDSVLGEENDDVKYAA